MKVNFIKNRKVSKNSEVFRVDEECIFVQPDKPKECLGMINYWSEKKRSDVSDEAVCTRMILDYDDEIPRAEVEEQFKDYEYIIYNSSSNKLSEGIEKFRMILTLKTPVTADDLRFWKKKRKERLAGFFKGVDLSSFDVGRFFYRPSRYDKDGAEVIIKKNEGAAFDFYAEFTSGERKLEEIKEKMKEKSERPYEVRKDESYEDRLAKFKRWLSSTYPEGVHRCDVPKILGYAMHNQIDLVEAESLFKEHYAGHTDWWTWWRSIIKENRGNYTK